MNNLDYDEHSGFTRAKRVDLGIYNDIQFDADDSAPTYIGMNLIKGKSNDALDWKIMKFSYSGSNVTRIQIAIGSWTNRASYF